MASNNDWLNKLRDERIAKEKARIQKLREINLKKYNKAENDILRPSHQFLPISRAGNSMKNNTTTSDKTSCKPNGEVKKISSVPITKKIPPNNHNKPTTSNITVKTTKTPNKETRTNIGPKRVDYQSKGDVKASCSKTEISLKDNNSNLTKIPARTDTQVNKVKIQKVPITNEIKKTTKPSQMENGKSAQKSTAIPQQRPNRFTVPRQSLLPTTKNRESVFERLYKPKPVIPKKEDDAQKLRSDPNFLKKVVKDANLLFNKRNSVSEVKDSRIVRPVRRSISAVHFKKISKKEINNCIHKWASMGDKINKTNLENIGEDDAVDEDKLVMAVKSERKKVKFQTPTHNFNTPRPEELQSRLKAWLQKRGKSLDSYYHLQCFGLDLTKDVASVNFDTKLDEANGGEVNNFDGHDENKENIALESDTDDDSYSENINEVETRKECESKEPPTVENGWRNTSIISESVDFNDTRNTTMTSTDMVNSIDEVLLGALNDLTELLKEGFEWEQCARWLRAIRERFPQAPNTAAYWECRAQLEERRGDLPASVQCWEEAIAKGTQHSIVEASLDQLLDKFMQLKISPSSGKRQVANQKLVDVKNVFKSTIIRFAVQQAKLRHSEGPKYTVTPVRRSSRLSGLWSGKRAPLHSCVSVRQADEILGQKLMFVPNETLHGTP